MYDPRLETFLCVADNGSFNKAAEVLYISPPAVIKQINGLEKSLGFSLFLRTHRGLFLTAAGASLAEDARYVIQYSKDSIVRARRAMEQGATVGGTKGFIKSQITKHCASQTFLNSKFNYQIIYYFCSKEL